MILKQNNANLITKRSSSLISFCKHSNLKILPFYFPHIFFFFVYPAIIFRSNINIFTEIICVFYKVSRMIKMFESFTSLGDDSSSFWSVFIGNSTLFLDSFFVAISMSRFFFR